MKKYANQIGADHIFDVNSKFVTNLGGYSPHYGKFKPIYDDKFNQYDNVLVCDTDVFPIEGLTENIFENFTADIGVCTEPFQPAYRAKIRGSISRENDERWAKVVESKWKAKMPRTSTGLLKVYNSGVVLYSRAGLQNARAQFVPFRQYVDMIVGAKLPGFYTSDQGYLHTMMFVCQLNVTELDNDWNRYVHHYYTDNSKKKTELSDPRTPTTKFVHIQLRTADHWDADKLWRITNRPVAEWRL